jgi:hypothetical protein
VAEAEDGLLVGDAGIADVDLEQEPVELSLGQRVRPLVLDGVLGGWASCIASSRAAWVFGGVRLISSASRTLVKTGPGRKARSCREVAWSV